MVKGGGLAIPCGRKLCINTRNTVARIEETLESQHQTPDTY